MEDIDYINAHISQAFEIVMVCGVFHNYSQLMGAPLLPKCLQVDPFYGAKDKCFFLVKVKQLRNVEKQCVLHFSQIG